MRCPDCNKFTSMDFSEPEVESLEVSATDEHQIQINATVRLERTCADCGTTLKEASLDIEETIDLDPESLEEAVKDLTKVDDLEISEDSVEQIEDGGGRYAKSYFGATVSYTVTADGVEVHSGTLSDKVPASGMDEVA